MAAQGVALVDPLNTAGEAFGLGLSRLLSVGLYLGKLVTPSADFFPTSTVKAVYSALVTC